jgi:hypothetical protein
MSSYQTLLEEAVALLDADRGFVVLHEPNTTKSLEFVATYEFDPALLQPSETFDENQYLWEDMLPTILTYHEPVLTTNADPSNYYCRKYSVIGWVLRCVIAVPLSKDDMLDGLLWCDKSIREKGIWVQQDLEQVATLVQKFDRIP